MKKTIFRITLFFFALSSVHGLVHLPGKPLEHVLGGQNYAIRNLSQGVFDEFLPEGVKQFPGKIGFPLNDLIEHLPGQPKVTFRQFSGYVNLEEKSGKSLFYYFVEAENDPMNSPLTIWHNGGPGCSSVGDSILGVGPFRTTKNARGLEVNPHSWIKASNLLFIDSPVGAGWSYSNTSSDYQIGDDGTNKDLLAFMLKWFEMYPNLKSRDLYLAGLSYGGHFIPNLANTMLNYNKQSSNFKFNLKGLALASPVLRYGLDALEAFELFSSRGLINNESHQQILKECNGIDEDNYSINARKWSEPCEQAMNKTLLMAFNVTSIQMAEILRQDLLRGPCDGKFEDLIMGKEFSTIRYEVDMCSPIRANFYFNIQEVQKAFHGNRTILKYEWGCSRTYDMADYNIDMLPTLKQILEQSIPITIFSGDQDGKVPTNAIMKHINKLAKDMNLSLMKDKALNHENKDAGRMYSFGKLLNVIVLKRANHHATWTAPSRTLFIFKNIVLKTLH